MTIVADESVDKHIVDDLRALGHDVLFIAECDPGIDDETALRMSRQASAILVTADKDFGELVFRQRLLHTGILLIRLAGLTPHQKAAVVSDVFEQRGAELRSRFAVVSQRTLRVREPQ